MVVIRSASAFRIPCAATSSGTPAAASAASPSRRCSAATGCSPRQADPTAACTTRRRRSASCSSSWPAAASHIDLFDYKPELVKRHGQPSDFGEHVEAFQNGLGPWLKPVWDFKPYGQCGKHAQRSRRPARRRRRRHRVRPQHGRQDRRPQPGHAAADDRLQPARLSRHGLLGQLRPRQPEREPADVRRAARPPRPGVERHEELGHARSCRPSTRARSSTPAAKTPIADLFPAERATFITPRRRRAPASTCSAS